MLVVELSSNPEPSVCCCKYLFLDTKIFLCLRMFSSEFLANLKNELYHPSSHPPQRKLDFNKSTMG
jgi:hypothetical protein